MATLELPPPDPDEYGQIPPQEQSQQEREDYGPGPLSIDDLMKKVKEDGFLSLELPKFREEPPLPRFHFEEYNFEPRMFRMSEERRRRLNDLFHDTGFVGYLQSNPRPPEPEAKPMEKLDPHPSRAGWRAEFLPPFDPTVEEPTDKPLGKIGEYNIIKSVTTFADIGGNALGIDLLTEIAHQFEYPKLYEKWDVPVPKGVLLHGPPGTGKTMLAKAFANKAKAAFVEVAVATLRDKYYGEAEKNLKKLFDQAAKYKGRVVLFFDEINSLLVDRSKLPSDHPDSKLVDTYLQAMDGMSSAPNVMVLGATNFLDRLDAAATRPGRMDRKVPVVLPDRAGCRQIVAKRLLSAERGAKRALIEDKLGLDEIAGFLEGLNGAGIAEVVNRVKRTMAQTERAMQQRKGLPKGVVFNGDERNALLITTDDIVAATLNYRLSSQE